MLAGALLAFTLSIDEFIIAYFTAGAGRASTTLPMQIYAMIRFGVTPEINALATLLMLASFTLVLLAQRLNSTGALTLPRTRTLRYPGASLETAAMQTTLERPAAATPHRFDVDDYYRMAEAGILSAKDRVELIEGEIVDMAPIGSEHGGTTNRLTELVARAVADGRVHRERTEPAAPRPPQRAAARPDAAAPTRRRLPRPATRPPPTSCSWSRSPTARSPTTAAPSSPSTPATACPRCGSSIWSAVRSRSAPAQGRRVTPSAAGSARDWRRQRWCQDCPST